MYPVDFVKDNKYEYRIGDICKNVYVPFALPGRYKYNVEDIENILNIWINDNTDGKKDLNSLCTVFKEKLFSLVLTKSKYENELATWQIFWCAWTDIFKNTFEKKNKYEEKYKDKLIEFQAGCIYLLFLTYFSQNVKNYHHTLPIYMSTSTFNLCLDVVEECEKIKAYNELRYILNFMLDTNSIIFSYNDRLTELYQDRYGNPLYIFKMNIVNDHLIKINDINLEKLSNSFDDEIKDLIELCDKQRKINTLSNSSTYALSEKLENVKHILNKDILNHSDNK